MNRALRRRLARAEAAAAATAKLAEEVAAFRVRGAAIWANMQATLSAKGDDSAQPRAPQDQGALAAHRFRL